MQNKMQNKMRAVTQDRYGIDALQVTDEPIPEPKAGEVRVRVDVASMNPFDWHFTRGRPAFIRLAGGLRRPKKRIVGTDLCGVVDAVGDDVSSSEAGGFDIGDVVFGSAAGAFAEYVNVKVKRLVRKPDVISHGEAAGLPVAGVTALQSFEGFDVAGKRVVINGASGGVGHYAIQIAKHLGAAHVAGVCSTRNLEFVKDLGADEVIDYTSDDFTRRQHDLIIDCAGRRSFSDVKRCLAADGRWVMVGPEKGGPILGPVPAVLGLTVRSKLTRLDFNSFITDETKERLEEIARLVNEGHLQTHIEREFKLDEIRDVFAHAGSHRTRGKITIRP